MTPAVLDAGALTRLAERTVRARERLRRLHAGGYWPPVVPSVVLTEALRGDLRKDFHEERLLAMCAVDAIVVAVAEAFRGQALTQDPRDLSALAAHTDPPVRVHRI
jgi:hypothetical protein